MRFVSATRLTCGLALTGAMLLAAVTSAQPRQAPATATKKGAATQRNAAVQKSDAAPEKNNAALQVLPG